MARAIVYTTADGNTVSCHPIPNARLVTCEGDTFPLFVIERQIGRALPPGVEWAESESEFFARIQAKDVPPDATNVRVVEV